jgi:chromosome segregation ATPase
MEREEAERKISEFNSRLNELAQKNPQLQPDSPEVKALIKEFNDSGIPIQIIKKEDIKNAMMGFAEMLSQMGMTMPTDEMENSRLPQTLSENVDPCKYHKKGLDDVKRNVEISKTDVENLAIDLNTKSDEEIWKMFS